MKPSKPTKTPTENLTDAKDLDFFRQEVSYWQEKLGMLDWRIVVIDKPTSNMAMVEKLDLESRTAKIRFGSSFGKHELVSPDTISSTALHEVLHVFLHELLNSYETPPSPPDVKYSAEHRVVNVLENVLFPIRHLQDSHK